MARSLYVCYFGVREPLVRTQVIPYLRELTKDGHELTLLTFEPDGFGGGEKSIGEQDEIKQELAAWGIEWHWLRYHKRLSVLATAYDIFRGAVFIRRMNAKKRFDILHGRVHVPTLMAALARRFSTQKPKLLFDIRGFFPEEYTDAGVWPEGGFLYRLAKRVERWLLKESDGFVVLTEKAREILFPESRNAGFDKFGRPVEVIPCCVDLTRFAAANGEVRDRIRGEIGGDGRRVIAYVGSFGGWYLTEEILDFMAVSRGHDETTFAMILTQRDPNSVAEKLRAKGFKDRDFYVRSVKPSELPDYLSAADIAVSFIKACYSKKSSSPTKIAEYLACGLPIISNRGVGDVDELIIDNKVGVLLDDFTSDSFVAALESVDTLQDIGRRTRESAKEFDLVEVGGERYRRLYSRLLEK